MPVFPPLGKTEPMSVYRRLCSGGSFPFFFFLFGYFFWGFTQILLLIAWEELFDSSMAGSLGRSPILPVVSPFVGIAIRMTGARLPLDTP